MEVYTSMIRYGGVVYRLPDTLLEESVELYNAIFECLNK